MDEKNVHGVRGTLGVRDIGKPSERETNDFYATTPEAAEWLEKIENLSPTIWEPACGQGHLAKVFEKNGHKVIASDLIDRGYGQGGIDFLKVNEAYEADIVTNPPFKIADDFILHALELLQPGHKLCLFLKVQFLEGVNRRRKIYDITPPARIWVTSSRLHCVKNAEFSGSMVAYAWFVWEKDFKGDTILKWFN